jgi:hypothetical protein
LGLLIVVHGVAAHAMQTGLSFFYTLRTSKHPLSRSRGQFRERSNLLKIPRSEVSIVTTKRLSLTPYF